MRYRSKLAPKKSRKMFTKHAVKTKAKNLCAVPMRGGFRI